MIILSGFSKAGKDEFAKGLPGYTRAAFADKLKEELAQSLGISVEELETRKEEFRGQMVELGRRRRAEDPEYWIKKLDPLPEGDIVITDGRYLNEIRWAVNVHAATCVYICRPEHRAANAEELDSICGIWNRGMVDKVVHNSGSIEELHKKALWIANTMGSKSG